MKVISLVDSLGEIKVNTWIKSIEGVSFDTSSCTLTAPSSFHKCILEAKYNKIIEDTINSVMESNFKLKIIHKQLDDPKPDILMDYPVIDHLIPAYTFENFISGTCNKKALNAATKASDANALSYMLYISGGAGTGKTHMLHAIGNKYKKDNKTAKILYVCISEYVNELTRRIMHDNPFNIEKGLEHIDLLLVDNLHLIKDKPFTQSQITGMLKRLKSKNVRLVLASTSSIETIFPNFTEQDIEVKIHKPDFNTKKKILQKYSKTYEVPLSYATVELIAGAKFQGIRELIGAFNKAKLQMMLNKAKADNK